VRQPAPSSSLLPECCSLLVVVSDPVQFTIRESHVQAEGRKAQSTCIAFGMNETTCASILRIRPVFCYVLIEINHDRRGGYWTEARFSISILGEGGRLGLKCLHLSYFRVGDCR
jgi:hypothetical protein